MNNAHDSFHPVPYIILILIAAACSSTAQNARPEVTNVAVTVGSAEGTLTVGYDVVDSENDPLEITLQLMNDSGHTITIPNAGITGHVGYPVQPGSGRQLVWKYDKGMLSALGNGTIKARIVADDRKPVEIAPIVGSVVEGRLRNDLKALVGKRNGANPAGLAFARTMIETHFEAHGLHVSREELAYVVGNDTMLNIIGNIPGRSAPDSVIILSAHYDTVEESPGADDNGSGVVGMMEAIRALSDMGFRKTVRFIGFDKEEDGLIGSQEYVESGIPANERIAGVLDFEMIGYYSEQPGSQTIPAGFNLLFPAQYDSIIAHQSRGDFLTNIANQNSAQLMKVFETSARTYVPALRTISAAVPGDGSIAPDFRRSDHAPFWDVGIPALLLTDGADFRNPNYHKSSDTLGTIDFPFMTNVVKATVATIAELAGLTHSGTGTSESFSIGTSDVGMSQVAGAIMLEQNIPNPFTASTSIGFSLPRSLYATLKVYDMMGREVATLIDGVSSSGSHRVDLQGERLSPGVYIYQLVAGVVSERRMMVVQ